MVRIAFIVSLIFISHLTQAQSLKIENNQLVLSNAIQFKTGSAELDKGSEKAFTEVKLFLEQKAYITLLRVEGHVAEGEKAQPLSEQRAMAVAEWLTLNGISCERLTAVGFGNTKPIYAADAPEQAQNTRIVFSIAALRDKLIGGQPADGGGKIAGAVCH